MPTTLRTPRHVRLVNALVEQRQACGLSQSELAARLGRVQSVVSSIESGGRRVDVVELLDIAAIIGLDVHRLIDILIDTPQSGASQLQRRKT